MSYLQQALFVFVLLQIFFGYLEYRYKPDIIYILGRLFNPKYLIPSLIIPPVYILLVIFIRFLFR